MAYVDGNPKTKKMLKDWIKSGRVTTVFQPGAYGNGPVPDGEATIEGPQYPAMHAWYARVRVESGAITKVIS